MAAFTVGPELAAMNVSVAIGAALADVLEDEAGMALDAAHLLMHAAQRIACAVVIELRNCADGLPTGVSVAVLAGDGHGTMRIGHLCLRTANNRPRIVLWLLRRQADQQGEQRNPDTREPTSPVHLLLHAPFAALPASLVLPPSASRIPSTIVTITIRLSIT
jgi:hypothetical protein